MRCAKPTPMRNKLDVADSAQVRIVSRRLSLSRSELLHIVGRVGNSIAAINKEVGCQKAAPSKIAPPPPELPSAAVISAAADTDVEQIVNQAMT